MIKSEIIEVNFMKQILNIVMDIDIEIGKEAKKG